ncbi:MAG: 3-oxoacyl-[acyl-carrier-protein] synthase, KASII, partial [uncultured Acetobacteraceae bacterium]
VRAQRRAASGGRHGHGHRLSARCRRRIRLAAAHSRPEWHLRHPVLRHEGSPGQGRRPGAAGHPRRGRPGPGRVDPRQGPEEDGPLHPARHGGGAGGGRGQRLAARNGGGPRRRRRDDRLRHRRADDHLRGVADGGRGPLPAHLALLHPERADQPRLRPRLHQIRAEGAEPLGRDGLRHRRPRARRRGAPDRARRRRRDGGRRRRGDGERDRHGRLLRLPRPVHGLQRHAAEGFPTLGRGPRRLRHGRGRRRVGAGRAGARAPARRQHLRRGHRLRHVRRRPPHHRALRHRRRRLPLHARRAAQRRARAGTGAVRERARHLHPARRRPGARRGGAAVGRRGERPRHVLHQVGDRPPARRRRGGGGHLLHPGDPRRRGAADAQPRQAFARERDRPGGQGGAGAEDRGGAVEQFRLRRHQREHRLPRRAL